MELEQRRARLLRPDAWSLSDGAIYRSGRLASREDVERALSLDDGAEIRSDLPQVRFSSLALPPRVRLSGAFPSTMVAHVVVWKLGQYTPVRNANGVVVGGTWHPVGDDALSSACAIVSPSLPAFEGPITAGRYVQLVGSPDELEFLVDDVVHDDSFEWASGIRALTPPPGLRAELFPYQVVGSTVLRTLASYGLGSLLADEMGLGKTIQVIALLLSKPSGDPSLVVVPASLVENWRRELLKFAPELSVLTHEGPHRTGSHHGLAGFDVVVTSYETLVVDNMLFSSVQWGVVAADEAQMIRNPETRRSIVLKQLQRQISVAVTGTPIENRVQDLWSISEFILPYLLGSREKFDAIFGGDTTLNEYLGRLVSPITVRRSVDAVASDLPDRLDIYTALTVDEKTRAAVSMLVDSAGNTLSRYVREQVLLAHADDGPTGDDQFEQTAKAARVLELLAEAFARREKVLVFASYLKAIDRLADVVGSRFPEAYVRAVSGVVATRNRQSIIDEFTSFHGPGCLILQIDAAGTGLNITAANHVIFFNPDWNPAKTKQAAARAFRRGQTKTVVVHHLFYADTLEEIQISTAKDKQDVANEVSRGMMDRFGGME